MSTPCTSPASPSPSPTPSPAGRGACSSSLGRLDFTDLLGQLRDLLVRDLAARRSLQERFGYLLVDEFQDTDPLQAESVVLLCEREPMARDWRDVVLAPGKLFVVGDPKQSIYRFRRADIALYDEVKELVRSQPQKQGEVLAIAQNFRATPALVGWANNVFGDIFDAEQEVGRQPGYQWVEAYRPSAQGRGSRCCSGGSTGGRPARATPRGGTRRAPWPDCFWRSARAIAGCGRSAIARCSTPGEEVTRPARWGDVALLVRATTGLETYEQTLREAGIPYRVEGGKTYFQRREVTDVLLCLRAIDDPSDGPAVYGALHSSLFGFSDDDLFLFWAAGGRFERGVETQPEGRAAVAEALGVLWGLHERRRVCETHELIEELLRATRAEELQAATGAAGQALANLEKLIERARAFTGAGGGGLGAFLAWAAEAGDAAGERESQVDDEADVVHLLTIHGAKGLEWPIVVLAGAAMAGSGGHGGPVEPIVDRRRRRVVVKLKADLPGATRDLIPRAYEELIEYEKGMAQSEARRLLYVALTRARDRLVVSCFGRLENAKGEATAALLGPLHQLLPAPGSVSERHEREGLLVLVPEAPPVRQGRAAQPDVPALLAARTAWMRAREELLARAARPARATSPSALEQVDDAVRVGGAGAPPGRARALALGAAVHRVMEFCDLNDAASLDPLAEHAAAEFGYPDLAARVTELAAVCWHATPVRAAARSGDVYRELVVGVLVGDTIMNGAVDLLYRDGAAGSSWTTRQTARPMPRRSAPVTRRRGPPTLWRSRRPPESRSVRSSSLPRRRRGWRSSFRSATSCGSARAATSSLPARTVSPWRETSWEERRSPGGCRARTTRRYAFGFVRDVSRARCLRRSTKGSLTPRRAKPTKMSSHPGRIGTRRPMRPMPSSTTPTALRTTRRWLKRCRPEVIDCRTRPVVLWSANPQSATVTATRVPATPLGALLHVPEHPVITIQEQ